MEGYQITFFTEQGRRHKGRQLAIWLMEAAKDLGIRGATLVSASQGFGHHGRWHSAHFFELSDQPLEIIMAVTPPQCDQLFKLLVEEKVRLVYVKAPVEFGLLGE